MAAADIRGGTGAAIAKKLWELDDAGCYVEIAADLIGYGKYSEPRTDPLRTLLMVISDEMHDAFRQNFWDIRECANLVWQASSADRYWGTPTHPIEGCRATR